MVDHSNIILRVIYMFESQKKQKLMWPLMMSHDELLVIHMHYGLWYTLPPLSPTT